MKMSTAVVLPWVKKRIDCIKNILHSSKNVNENGCHAYLPLSYQNDTDEGEETLLGFLYFGGELRRFF